MHASSTHQDAGQDGHLLLAEVLQVEAGSGDSRNERLRVGSGGGEMGGELSFARW